ncbi:MAG TPA: hypothetical protein VF282_11525, partial [Bacillota bacterium]
PPPAQRLTVVVAQGLMWQDLDRLGPGPGQVAAALLTPPPSGTQPDGAYLTVGAGVPAGAQHLPVPPLERDESWWDTGAARLHRRLTGFAPGDAAVVVPSLSRLIDANRDRSPPVTPGWLGESLARHGLKTAVLGEADFPARGDGRGAALLAMDASGTVAYGQLAGLTRPDDSTPAGRVQDWPAVIEAWSALPADAAVVVIESGDLARLEAAAPLLSPARWVEAREEAVERLAAGIAGLQGAAAGRPGRHPIWVLAAAPARSPGAARFGVLWTWSDAAPGTSSGHAPTVPPVAAAGTAGVAGPARGGGAQGRAALLTSPSTRRWGVLPLTDLAPAILAELGIDDGRGLGRAVVAGAAAYPWGRLVAAGRALEEALGANHDGRVTLIQGYVLLLIATALAALAAVRWRALGGVVAWAAPAMASVPLVFLLLPGLGIEGPAPRAAVSALLAAAVACWAQGRSSAQAFAILAGLTMAAVLGDLLAGGAAAVRSPLGHSLLVGARYYGVGNEYGGVLVGSAALTGGLVSRWVRAWAPGPAPAVGACVPAAAGVLLLHPALGANFGCGLAAFVASGAFLLKALEGRRHRRRAALGLAAAAAVAVTLAVVGDAAGGAASTHVGRAAQQAAAGNWEALLEIARRKGLLNWRLIQYTIWSRVFVASLVAVTVLVLRPASGLRRLSRRQPELFTGVLAAVIGACAALVLNDSGVVAAATAMILPTTVAAHALLQPGQRPPERPPLRLIDTPGRRV